MPGLIAHGFQRALSDVDVEPARDYAGQRADLVRSVERILEPRPEGQGRRPLSCAPTATLLPAVMAEWP